MLPGTHLRSARWRYPVVLLHFFNTSLRSVQTPAITEVKNVSTLRGGVGNCVVLVAIWLLLSITDRIHILQELPANEMPTGQDWAANSVRSDRNVTNQAHRARVTHTFQK